MNWGQLRDLFLDGVGDSPQAARDAWKYLTLAARDLASRKTLAELYQADARVDTVAGQDYVDLDCDVYSILTITDLSNGHKLYPEPEEARSRAQFLLSTGKPPTGQPHFWLRLGKRIYLRDTPPDVRELLITYREQVPDLSEADMPNYPRTPAQYDEALYLLAQSKWYANHPGMIDENLSNAQHAIQLKRLAELRLTEPREQIVEERLDRRHYVRTPGYSCNVRGR